MIFLFTKLWIKLQVIPSWKKEKKSCKTWWNVKFQWEWHHNFKVLYHSDYFIIKMHYISYFLNLLENNWNSYYYDLWKKKKTGMMVTKTRKCLKNRLRSSNCPTEAGPPDTNTMLNSELDRLGGGLGVLSHSLCTTESESCWLFVLRCCFILGHNFQMSLNLSNIHVIPPCTGWGVVAGENRVCWLGMGPLSHINAAAVPHLALN